MKKTLNIKAIVSKVKNYFLKNSNNIRQDFFELRSFYANINPDLLKPNLPLFFLKNINNMKEFSALSNINQEIIRILIKDKAVFLLKNIFINLAHEVEVNIYIYYADDFTEKDFILLKNQVETYNKNIDLNISPEKISREKQKINSSLELANINNQVNDFFNVINTKENDNKIDISNILNQQNNFKKKINLVFELVPELISGIKLQVQNQIFDYSIANKIKQLRETNFL